MIGSLLQEKGGLVPPFVVQGLQPWVWGTLLSIGPLWTGVVQAAATAVSQAAVVVYRCPGPPVLYTDALTPEQAKAQQCHVIEGTPLTVGTAAKRAAVTKAGSRGHDESSSPTASAASSGATAVRGTPGFAVDPAAQRERDAQARAILLAELNREEERLSVLQAEYKQGQPERRSDERNAAKYLDRIEALRVAISRKESDIAALKREIAGRTP